MACGDCSALLPFSGPSSTYLSSLQIIINNKTTQIRSLITTLNRPQLNERSSPAFVSVMSVYTSEIYTSASNQRRRGNERVRDRVTLFVEPQGGAL